MNKGLIGTMAALLAAGWFTCELRADDGALRNELQTQYTEIAKALRAKDLPALIAHVAPDYSSVTAEGKQVNRQQLEANLKQMLEGTQSITECRFTVSRVKLDGNEATVTINSRISANVRDPSGRLQRRTDQTSRQDTWSKTAEGWKLKQVGEVNGPQAARTCLANIATIASAESAFAIRFGAYTSTPMDFYRADAPLTGGVVRAPEGLTEAITCPLDGKTYRIVADMPESGDITISCPNAARHAADLGVDIAQFQRTMQHP